MLDGFGEDPPGVRVARFRDGAQLAVTAGGVLMGYQTEERHHVTRMREPPDVAQFSHQHGRSGQLKTPQTHQGLHRRIHPPLRHLCGDQIIQSPDPLHRLMDRQQVFFQHGFQRGQPSVFDEFFRIRNSILGRPAWLI